MLDGSGAEDPTGAVDHYVDPDGERLHPTCALVRIGRLAAPTPALFLDRDGVVIEEKHYLHDPDDVVLIPGVADAIGAARARGWAVVVVTNQAGIGRGYYGFDDYRRVEERVADELAALGATIDAVYACPYHPEGRGDFRRQHSWRKPGPGMLRAAARDLNIDLSRSILAGDRLSDLEAAAAAGLAAGVLVGTGYGREEAALERPKTLADWTVHVVGSIADVPAVIGL